MEGEGEWQDGGGGGGDGDVYGHLLFGHFQCIQFTGSSFPSFETPCISLAFDIGLVLPEVTELITV